MSSYPPDSRTLRGLTLERAELFGKPNVYAEYTGGVHSYRRDPDAVCVCGRPATQCHHIPPLAAGGANASYQMVTDRSTYVLTPSLIALCGNGNAGGCHGRIHRGDIRIRWVWNSERDAEAWWSGKLLSRVGNMAHGSWLYDHGKWVAEIDGNTYENRGRGWDGLRGS